MDTYLIDVTKGLGKVVITLSDPVKAKREEQSWPHEVRVHPRHIGQSATMETAELFARYLRQMGWNAVAWEDGRTATWMFSDRGIFRNQVDLFQEAFADAYSCLHDSAKRPEPMFYPDWDEDEA